MQQAVGGDGGPAVWAVLAVQGGEASAGLRDDRRQRCQIPEAYLRLGGNIHRTLGDQHVGPEVAVSAQAPRGICQVDQLLALAAVRPAGKGGNCNRGVRDLRNLRNLEAAGAHRRHPTVCVASTASAAGVAGTVGAASATGGSASRGVKQSPCAGAFGGPPAAPQRRRGDNPHHGLAVHQQADQRGPHGHTTHEVLGAVDGVDDPLTPGKGDVATEFLSQQGVLRVVCGDQFPQFLLYGGVCVAHWREVGLRFNAQIICLEARHGDRVGRVGQRQRQGQVICIWGNRVRHDTHDNPVAHIKPREECD